MTALASRIGSPGFRSSLWRTGDETQVIARTDCHWEGELGCNTARHCPSILPCGHGKHGKCSAVSSAVFALKGRVTSSAGCMFFVLGARDEETGLDIATICPVPAAQHRHRRQDPGWFSDSKKPYTIVQDVWVRGVTQTHIEDERFWAACSSNPNRSILGNP